MAKVQIKSDNFTAFGGVLTTETCIWQFWPLEGKYTYDQRLRDEPLRRCALLQPKGEQ